jgi:cardiolipin synthase
MFGISINHLLEIIGIFLALIHFGGILASIDVIMNGRTSQGTIAWVILLLLFPYISLPLYIIFGNRKFSGYVNARKIKAGELNTLAQELINQLPSDCAILKKDYKTMHTTEKLAKMPFTKGNKISLLIDGKNTFAEIFNEIDKAKEYIIVQFFIIKNDGLGNKLKNKLINKAKEKIKIYLLYDEIGCFGLPKKYFEDLRNAGINVQSFKTKKGWTNPFQLNFRNHRKIVIVDGNTAFVGGHNVGDEYLGLSKKFGHWRDTHTKIQGPAVQAVQLAFLEDWYWATKNIPKFKWSSPLYFENHHILVLPSGPADELETCSLFFQYAINYAKKRIWITSPYFVPEPQIISSLHLAAIRGVDVRIMLPEKPDHILVYLSSFAFLDDLTKSGVKFYRYKKGFLHQKVMLIDDDVSTVGTVNFDNRSFHINFEITLLTVDKKFTKEVEKMLENDFKECRMLQSNEYKNKPFWFKVAVRIATLMSPIQ